MRRRRIPYFSNNPKLERSYLHMQQVMRMPGARASYHWPSSVAKRRVPNFRKRYGIRGARYYRR